MNFSEFLERNIKPQEFYWVDPDEASSLDFPFEITAKEFVAYANRDLDTAGNHGLANALSNAKRAIDCQVDAVTNVLGIKKERFFPKKADKFSELGLMAPRVIKRINQLRNYLEHEFKIPEQERVEDAVDTATLFVELTQRVFRNFQTAFKFGGGDEELMHSYSSNYVQVSFSYKLKQFEVECVSNKESILNETIDSSCKEYIPLLKLTLSSDWNYSDLDHQEIVKEFIERCTSP